MHRLAILLALSGACHKTKPTTATAGSGSGSGSGTSTAPFAKRMAMSWGISQQPNSADIFLATTDERGAQVSHPLGTFPGTCSATKAAAEMQALIALTCKDGATGIELHVIDRRDRVLVLKMRIDDGIKPDPMAREQIAEIEIPLGAKIEAAY
jgi:hypothetical protein